MLIMEKKLYTIIVHSENIAGLLNQVTAVFTRRQINIESLNVSASSLYRLSTPEFQSNPMASKVIRRHNARIVEVNPVYCIVEKNGMSEDITGLYEELNELNCVLQFVRSGRVAITKSNNERVSEFLEYREEKYRKQKLGLND